MADNKPPEVRPGYQTGPGIVTGTPLTASPSTLNGKDSQYKTRSEYSDPFFTGGIARNYEERMKIMEGFADHAQPWYDKLGNGVVKFGGSFASGLLSVPGSIFGTAGAILNTSYDAVRHGAKGDWGAVGDAIRDDGSLMWNNVFNQAGNDLQDAINENFRNYESLQQQNAGAWSPKNWMTLNFFADNILGNAGYAAAAYLTGRGSARLFSKMAPYIAGRNVKAALDIVKTSGVEALGEFNHLATSLRRFDNIQKITSLGIAATSEASVEAYSSYKEFKQKMMRQLSDKFGGDDKIPEEEIKRLEADATKMGNIVFGLNIPILAGADLIQFGKSLSSYKTQLRKEASNSVKLRAMDGLLSDYAEREATQGFKAGALRGLKATGKALVSNVSEAGQEGAQFIISEGGKNYFGRKYDKDASNDSDNWMQSYFDAMHDLVTTKEGVANLLGGFGTPVMMPHTWLAYKDALFNTDNKKQTDFQLQHLNSLNAKETVKKAYESMTRQASIEKDLATAVRDNDEFEGRNLENEQMKNYVQSRIEAGRYDLLQDEIKQMQQMDENSFKQFLGLDDDQSFDHKAWLKKYETKAKAMHSTWRDLDRVFQPALYRVDDDKKDDAIKAMGAYKEMAWSYLMDARDADERLTQLRDEVDKGLGGILSLKQILSDKSTDPKLNSLIKQYNTLAVEREIKQKIDPTYKDKKEYSQIQSILGKIKYKINTHVRNNKGTLGLPEYIDKGNPEFLEEYMFDIEKQLPAISQDAIFSKALLGTDGSAMVDTSEVTRKLNDLRRLEQRRMLAVQGYNNLSSVIREGKYMDLMVKNPLYDKDDPEKGPEFIDNEKLLHSDNYRKFADERDEYRKEEAAKEDENRQAQDLFISTMEKETTYKKNPGTEQQKKFKERYNYHFHGDKTNKGVKSMDPSEFQDSMKKVQEDALRAQLTQQFKAFTRADRDKFDIDAYTDLRARQKAHEDSAKARNKKAEKEAMKMGQQLATGYHEIYDEQGAQVAEEWYSNRVKELKAKYHEDIVKLILDPVDDVRRDLGVLKVKLVEKKQEETGEDLDNQGDLEETEDDEDPITKLFGPPGGNTVVPIGAQILKVMDTPERYQSWSNTRDNSPEDRKAFLDHINLGIHSIEEGLKRGATPLQALDTTKDIKAFKNAEVRKQLLEIITNDQAKKPTGNKPNSTGKQTKGQAEPNNANTVDGEQDNRTVNDFLTTQELLNPTYLVFRRSDLETGLTFAPIKTLNSVKVGDNLRVTVNNGTVEGIVTKVDDTHGISLQDKDQQGHRFTIDDLKKFKLEKGYMSNAYENGKVKIKQFDAKLTDPKSPYYLAPGKRIKLEKNGNDKKGYPFVQVFVQGDIEGDWYKTDIKYSLDPSRVAAQFRKEVPEKVITAITAKVNALAAKLKTSKSVQAVISNDTAGFGKLIFNEGNFGSRQPISAGEAFGLSFINAPDKTGGSLFGVVANDDVAGNDIRMMTTGGSMVSLNSAYAKAYVPQSAIDAVTKSGNKAGQAIMALPTGKIHEGKQVYIPVMLNTRDMINDLTGFKRDDGTQMNIGEAVLDIILNPSKTEYQKPLAALFQLVGKRYDASNPDWEGFYTNENMYDIFSRLFFVSGKSIGDSRFAYPIAIYAETVDTAKGKSTKVSIDITKQGGALRHTEKRVDIYITGSDGLVNTSSVQDRMNSYFQNNQSQRNLDTGMQYDEILDTVAPKPYRVDAKLASQKATNPFDAIVLEDGIPAVKRFDSYWHYLDNQKILTSTVQGIQSGDSRFYFVNAPVAYNFDEKSLETTEAVEEKKPLVGRLGEASKEARKEGSATEVNKETIANLVAMGIQTANDGKGTIIASNFGNKLRNFGKSGPAKGMIDFTKIQTVNQFTIPSIDNHVSVIASEIGRDMIDLLLDAYTSNKSTKFNRAKLKRMLQEKMENVLDDLKVTYWRLEHGKQTEDTVRQRIAIGDRIESYQFALRYFDHDSIKKNATADDRDLISTVDDNGKRHYFVGFFNLALNDLFKSRIVDVWANGREMLDFASEEGTSYTTRYDDGWSFKIDPRDTLGKYSRIILSTIPEYYFDETGKLQPRIGPLGSTKYIAYEAAYKALISYGVDMKPTEVFDFFQGLSENPETASNPVLQSIHLRLQSIRSQYGNDAYMLAVRHLANPMLLQQANHLVINTQTSMGRKAQGKRRNADDQMFNLSRQMINDELVSIWSNGLSVKVRQGQYIDVIREIDKETDTPVTRYFLKLHKLGDNSEVTMMDYIKDRLAEAMMKKGEDKYKAIAEVYVNDLGFPLTSDGTIEGTSAVLKTWNTNKKNGSKIFKKQFRSLREYASLDEMVRDTILNYIVKPIEDSVKAGTFQVEEPLRGSTTVLNTYAKALKGYFQDVVNASVNDINNNRRYIYVPRNNLSEQMLLMKDIDYLWDVANSTYGRYMPAISAIFRKDDDGNYLGKEDIDIDAWERWQKLDMDYVNGMVRDDYIRQEAKDAKAGSWDLISLKAYQNNETFDSRKGRGEGRYVLSFGDATTAPYYKFDKQMIGADIMIGPDNNIRIALQDKVGEQQISTVKEQMFQVFLSEVNRSVEAVRKFSSTKKADIERQLRPGDHYVKVGKNYHMGALAGVYNFGKGVYDMMLGSESPIFTTSDISTGGKSHYVVTGINKAILKKGKLNQERLREVFDGFVNRFVSDMVQAKMEQLEPFMSELLEVNTAEQDGHLKVTGYKMPLFDNAYIKSFSRNVITKGRVTVNGQRLEDLYNKDTSLNGDHAQYATKEEAMKRSYAAHLFHAMILDQQLNHFLFRANFTAANGIDPALFQKPGKADYDSFYDNWDKRMKQMVTPKINTVTVAEDKVRIICYNDLKMSDTKTTLSVDQQNKLSGFQREMLKHMQSSTVLKRYVTADKKGAITLPERILGHQIETMFYLYEEQWKGTPRERQAFDDQIKEYLESKSTDGFSVISLKEYLYRKYLDGQISTEQEFKDLYKIFSDPNLALTPQQLGSLVPIQALKYVMSGTKIEAGEMMRIYGKDAEFPLLPVMTKGTPWDDIRKDMESLESEELGGGTILKPLSAMKLGAVAPVNLFDESGKYTGHVASAVVSEWSRGVSGKQIQNPDKQTNLVTASIQADKYIHNDVDNNVIFGENVFEQDYKSAESRLEEAIAEGDQIAAIQNAARMVQDSRREQAGEEKKKRQGIFNTEMMAYKFRSKEETMRRDLMDLMGEWGLKYQVGGPEYKRLIKSIGLSENSTVEDLQKVMGSDNKDAAEIAFRAYKIRKRVIMSNVNEFLNDIKAQLLQRKGLTINNTYMLRLAEGLANTMDVPVTFAVNSSQIQAVILSRINKIINGRKLPGSGYVQMPSLQASKDLKGYTPRLDSDGNFIGLNAAECVLPWRFTDPKTGMPLDFNKYCNADGTIKKEMWDPALLEIVGLRIPGTGANTLGYFKAVKFTPGYRDAAQFPAEIVAQMNSDFDFDKMYSYTYNFSIHPETGKLQKINGYLHHSQKGVGDFLNSEVAKKAAVRYQLEQDNEEYMDMLNNATNIVNAKVRQFSKDILANLNSEKEEDEEMDDLEDLLKKSLGDKYDLLYSYLDESDYGELGFFVDEVENTENKAMAKFDMEAFLKTTPNALQVIQSREQLENAQIEAYHIMLSNPEIARKMLRPLTTKWVKDQLDERSYETPEGNMSLRDMRENKRFKSPVSEVSNSNTKVSNAGADLMIGIEANAQSLIFYAQHADLTLSTEFAPILFADKNNKTIEEEKYDKDLFTISEKAWKATLEKNKDNVQQDGRHRLGRIYGRDEQGDLVAVSTAVQSTLQASLDNANDPIVGIANINEDTANSLNTMLMLGYIDHAMPMINQHIVGDYVRVLQEYKGVMRGTDMNNDLIGMIMPYLEKSGRLQEVEAFMDRNDLPGKKFSDWMQALDALYTKPFSVSKLKGMIVEGVMSAERTPSWYADQLSALVMFNRVKKIGDKLFELQQGINVESKGFKEVSVVGVDRQLTDFNRVSKLPFINVEKITDPRSKLFNTVLASRYGLNVVRDLFQYGQTNMFEDLAPAMKTMRMVAGYMNRKTRNGTLENQLNIGVKQFILSDLTLFQELINDIDPSLSESDELRELLMKEHYGTIPEGEKQRYDLASNTAVTVAGLLEKVSNQTAPDGIPYKDRYEVLANLRPIIQKNNDNPSAVVYLNANNYKQRLDVLIPKSIMQMLEDENDDVKTLAKMLIVYSYMVGGTNNPISYINHVPQEVLAKYKFGERIRKRMGDLNEAFDTMMSEFERNMREEGEEDEDSYVNKILSGRYISSKNQGALNVLRAFVYQYYQHHPFDLRDKLESDEFDAKDIDHVTVDAEYKPPMFYAVDKGKAVPYINSYDAEGTYREADSLGYKFNISEYSFNTNGYDGRTIVSRSGRMRSLVPAILRPIVTHEQEYAYTVPYMMGRTKASLTEDYLNSYTAPMRSALKWAADNSRMKAESANSEKAKGIHNGIAAISDYLNQFIPGDLQYGMNTNLTVNGLAAAGKADLDAQGRTTKVWFNPLANENEDRPVHYKSVMLHEGTHVALSHVIDAIRRMKDGKITAEDAAKMLGVTTDGFNLQVEGFNRLEKMLKNKKVSDAIRKAYVQAFSDRYKNLPTVASMESEQDIARIAKQMSDYSLSDMDEFIAFVLSDRDYRDALNKVQYDGGEKNKSIWKRMVELFMDILGIKQGSALEEAFHDIMSLAEPMKGVEAKMGNLTTTKEVKAKLSFEDVAVPFYIPVADIAERFNFKQENC